VWHHADLLPLRDEFVVAFVVAGGATVGASQEALLKSTERYSFFMLLAPAI
jgi:hypothetical protein